jgi:hypothetical protein
MTLDDPQVPTLFDQGDAGWKLEILVKFGGGPFDPAGWSVQLIRPDGGLHAAAVHSCSSTEHDAVQLVTLLASAGKYAIKSHTDPELGRRWLNYYTSTRK